MTRLWDKGLPLDERVLRYTAGEDHLLDARLVHYDVRGSIAHAEMLADVGLIDDIDCRAICDRLRELEASFDAGEWQISLEDEDVHTALESRLSANIGEAGGRLHLGRSRNDQVLTALRLYLRDATGDLIARVATLRRSVAAIVERQGDVKLPGYTHMQHAMPSSVALWCGGFDEAFGDAAHGLKAALRRIDKNPLGSAAGYGTPGLPLDREATTTRLKFAATQTPVTAVQLSRGIADEVTTGSSIMPQKRNPDVLELLRGASAPAQACLDESLMITAKLPSGYHRDLQRLKAPLFRGIDLAVDSVDIMAHVIDGLTFVADNIELDDGLFATEEAYRMVRELGIPFREAYRQVAKRYAGR
jgi:argininosuccinate lyase